MSESFGPLDADGWLAGATHIMSPNHDARPAGETVSLLVIHAISLPPGRFGGNAVIDLFTNRLAAAAHPDFAMLAGARVSAHFLVRRDGALIQFVSCFARAWHAGVSCWKGRERCNDFSLGIELEGDDFTPFDDAQYATLGALIERLRQSFSLVDIVGHADIAAGRKTDPGPYFDWSRIPQGTR
ncbi:MAG: 1,6-anhydro-N-acetylmuramyl-L-alanine amidase AmpD [Rhodocyclaceae bacterium]